MSKICSEKARAWRNCYSEEGEFKTMNAVIRKVENDLWVVCPYCYKKLIKLLPDTKIHNMPYKCKGSKCQKEFLVNVE